MLIGTTFVIIGLMLFVRGLETGLFPIGEALAVAFARKGSLIWLLIFGFGLGFSNHHTASTNPSPTPGSRGLRFGADWTHAVSGGIGESPFSVGENHGDAALGSGICFREKNGT